MGVYIEIALSLIFIYLVLSLVVSAVNELIAMWLRMRPKMLARSLFSIIDDKKLWESFYNNGLLMNTSRAAKGGDQEGWAGANESNKLEVTTKRLLRRWRSDAYLKVREHPSFIDGTTFAKALLVGLLKKPNAPVLVGDKATQESKETALESYDLEAIQTALAKIEGDSQIRDVLVASAKRADQTLDNLEAELAAWYDRTQDRLSGTYTRRLKWITLGIGAILALILNVDTIQLVQRLRADQDLRDELSGQAMELSTNYVIKDCQGTVAKMIEGERARLKVDEMAAEARATAETRLLAKGSQAEQACYFDQIRELTGRVSDDFLGWQRDPVWTLLFASRPAQAGDELSGPRVGEEGGEPGWRLLPKKLAGLLITVFAISLGAPFWFDMLSKVVNIRAAGVKPEEKAAPVLSVRAEEVKAGGGQAILGGGS